MRSSSAAPPCSPSPAGGSPGSGAAVPDDPHIEAVDPQLLVGKDEIDEDDEMELAGAELALGDDEGEP